MVFFCSKCGKTFFSEKETITHLKKDHFIIDNVDPINCIVKNCSKTYNTFKGLQNHLKTCVHNVDGECLLDNNDAAISMAYEFSSMHLTQPTLQSNYVDTNEEVKLKSTLL